MKIPKVPEGWRLLDSTIEGGGAADGFGPIGRLLRVRWDDEVEVDGHWWRHVSIARQARMWPGRAVDELPGWIELEWVRRQFVGPDREAYQVHPPLARYVNHHGDVLHLWSLLEGTDGAVLPDFRHNRKI